MNKNFLKPVGILALLLLFHQPGWSKINLLSPWSLQDRLPTEKGQIDQSAGFQFGLNGISPVGADRDSDFMAFPYRLSFGLLDKFEIGTRWGLHWIDRKDTSSQFGISDLAIATRYRFFEPNRTERMPGLDLEAGFSFPTGSFEKGLGSGGLGLLFGWGVVLPLDPLRAHFGMGFRYDTENSDNVRVGNVFSYNGGASFPLKQYKNQLTLTGEFKGFNHARNRKSGDTFGSGGDELYLSPGATWSLNDRFRLAGSLLIGLTSDSSDLGLHLEFHF